MVTNVRVEQLTDTSVRVSWHQIFADEITNYAVYYKPSDNTEQSEESVTVPSSESSVVIGDLMINVEYQFQVAAIAEMERVFFTGQRSLPVSTVVSDMLSGKSTLFQSRITFQQKNPNVRFHCKCKGPS